MDQKTADCINVLGAFLGIRDLEKPEPGALSDAYGIGRADVMVLFGGSILAGGDLLADAIRKRLAACYVIAGGEGHTTQSLRDRVRREYPGIRTEGLSEAEIFQNYLQEIHGCRADYLEKESTNCGNNVTNLLQLLRSEGIAHKSMIICQDASMQRRMDAGFRKYLTEDTLLINYAAYAAHAVCEGGNIVLEGNIHGMWDPDAYVSLLMGEIPRLRDDRDGYGPRGRNYIAHVEIPDAVNGAFKVLQSVYGNQVRPAKAIYASK